MPNELEVTLQVSRSGSGSWSVTTTLVAGPAPVLVTVMVKDAVSPGWITFGPPPVITLVMCSSGNSVTLADAPAVMTLPKLPRFWARVKATVAVLTSGLGSPDWMARVSVKLNDAPGARLPPPAATASASRFPSRVSVKELLASVVDRTRLGLSAELVLATVYV